MEYPTRHQSHVQETASFRSLVRSVPAHWILRYATERDYGIDCLIEPVDAPGGYIRGDLLAVQLKGVERLPWPAEVRPEAPMRFSGTDGKTVNYWMGLPVPVFLCVAEESTGHLYFAPVKHQVRRRYDELLSQKSFGFDLYSPLDLSSSHGTSLMLVLYQREKTFSLFSAALTDLLANREQYVGYIEEHIGRDVFSGVDTSDLLTLFRLHRHVVTVCGYAGSNRQIGLLDTYFEEDRLAFPDSCGLLHEITQTRMLIDLAPLFLEALKVGFRVITKAERHYWESVDPLLVRYASERHDSNWIVELESRLNQIPY